MALEEYRSQFPITEHLIWMNHAAIAPLVRPAAEAMIRFSEDSLHFASAHYEQWLETYAALRRSTARLIGAAPSEIALLKNTSEGLATVAMGLDWRAGDKIVAFREEFPANQYPWQRLEGKGVRIEWLSAADSLDKIDAAAQGARLLALSFVQFLTGHRADLNAIGEICHRRGAIFVVDAIQGLGVFPVDVKRAKIGALAADGHKWMFGPEGCAIFYISPELQERVEAVEFGWTNIAHYADYGRRDLTLRPDAGRYECGTLNTIGCYGLNAAIEFILHAGVERIGERVQALGDRIAEGVAARGYEVLGTRTPENGAGIVSFRKSSESAEAIVSKLKQHRIVAAPRAGWVRASPHFYLTEAEIDQMLALL